MSWERESLQSSWGFMGILHSKLEEEKFRENLKNPFSWVVEKNMIFFKSWPKIVLVKYV